MFVGSRRGARKGTVVPTVDQDSSAYGASRRYSSDPPDFAQLEARLVALEAGRAGRQSWLNAHSAAVMVAVIAAVVPATVALHTWIASSAERELAAQQHAHAMRMDYLKTALDTSAPAKDREIRLRLLVNLLEDEHDRLRMWASDELGRTEKQVVELTASLESAEQEAEQARSEVLAAERTLAAASTGPGPNVRGSDAAPAEAPADPKPTAAKPSASVVDARARLLDAKLRSEKAIGRARVNSQKLTGRPELTPFTALPAAAE
jgi:hypothetical protein